MTSATTTKPFDASAIRFGDLEVVRTLGRGLMGEVFEARSSSGERFVVKRMRRGTRGLIDIARFMREAEVMGRLAHPNIMPIVRVAPEADPPYFVMPWREGRTVHDRLAEGGRVPLSVVARVGRDIGLALAEVHRLGIVHRDVKPANMLLEASGRAVLIDFGLAKLLAPHEGIQTALGTLLGTPAYMAPEQCRGEPVDARCDVYSLGVSLFELLAGQNPFAAKDVVETIRRQLDCTPRRLDALFPHRVPAELGELIARMIAKDPDHRPTAERCLETLAGIVQKQERVRSAATCATLRPAV